MKQKKLTFQMPKDACNAHLHIIDPAFPNDGKAESQRGTVEEYQLLATALGLPRAVFVQAKPFGLDNTCLLDAIGRFGLDHARGIAVVNSSVSDAELERLHAGGVRGLRFSVWNAQNAVVSLDDCLPLSERIKHLGWNIQLHMGSSQIIQQEDMIRKLNCQVVIDHMGRLNPSLGIQDPAWKILQEMVDKGNTWIKLSGPYLNTQSDEPWLDAEKTARAIGEFAPERVVWGSDFPHVTEKEKPDEFVLTNLISLWLPTERARRLALTDNPAKLYGF